MCLDNNGHVADMVHCKEVRIIHLYGPIIAVTPENIEAECWQGSDKELPRGTEKSIREEIASL